MSLIMPKNTKLSVPVKEHHFARLCIVELVIIMKKGNISHLNLVTLANRNASVKMPKLLLLLILLISGCSYTNPYLIEQSELSNPRDKTQSCYERIQHRGERYLEAKIPFSVRIYYNKVWKQGHIIARVDNRTYPEFWANRNYVFVTEIPITTIEQLRFLPKNMLSNGEYFLVGDMLIKGGDSDDR